MREDTGGSVLCWRAIIRPVVVQIRPEAIDLARLRAWADEWDHEGDGACWPAQRFVAWVERNLAARADDRGDGIRQAGAQRRSSNVTR